MNTWVKTPGYLCISALLACGGEQRQPDLKTELTGFQLFYGGPIYTMDTSQPQVEAVVFSNAGRITFAGPLKTARDIYPRAERRDLAGKTLMPGFIEQHLHPFLAALTLSIVVIAPGSLGTAGKNLARRRQRQRVHAGAQGCGVGIGGRHGDPLVLGL